MKSRDGVLILKWNKNQIHMQINVFEGTGITGTNAGVTVKVYDYTMVLFVVRQLNCSHNKINFMM